MTSPSDTGKQPGSNIVLCAYGVKRKRHKAKIISGKAKHRLAGWDIKNDAIEHRAVRLSKKVTQVNL